MFQIKLINFLFKLATIIVVIIILGFGVWYFFPNFLNINRYLPAEKSNLDNISQEQREGLIAGQSVDSISRSEIELEFRNQNTELKKKQFLENLAGEKVIWTGTFRNAKEFDKDGYDFEITIRDGQFISYLYTNDTQKTKFDPDDKVLIEARLISVTELFFTFTVKAKVIDIQKL
jgi:hypothetical protein